MQLNHSEVSFSNQKGKQENSFQQVINSFNINVCCKDCDLQLSNCDVNQLLSHYLQCREQLITQLDKNEDKILTHVIQQVQCDHITNSQQISQLCDQILIQNDLAEGSKGQYSSTIRKFLKKEKNFDLNTISNQSLLSYLKHGKPTLQKINSIQYLRKTLNLPQTDSVNKKLQELRRGADAKKKKILINHGILYIYKKYKFIEDLCMYKNEILAFRIYILYELAARISELQQISFEQLLDGKITYFPKKQEKCGPKAMRNFIICDTVKQQTKIFMIRNKINQASTLDIGQENIPSKSKSFQKQLRKACQELLKTRNHQNHQDYNQFLLNIKYHDLRHTKLSEMLKSGVDQKVIQQFVKHSNLKVTASYLKNVHLESMIDLNLGCVRQVNSTYKSMILKLYYI